MSLSQARRQPQPNFLTDLLDPKLAERAGENIVSVADWRALGRRRYQIFGVTAAMVAAIDAAIAELRP